MTNNTHDMRTEDSNAVLSALDDSSHHVVTEHSFRDLGLDLSPLALEKALARASEIANSDVELTEGRLRDIAAEATAGLEALDDVVASFR